MMLTGKELTNEHGLPKNHEQWLFTNGYYGDYVVDSKMSKEDKNADLDVYQITTSKKGEEKIMKKWLIILGALFVAQIPFNLHFHAYYYATHMHQQKKQYPFVTLLGSNYLPQTYVPSYKVKNKDLIGSYLVTVKLSKGNKLIELDHNYMSYYNDTKKKDYYLQDYYSLSFSDNGSIDESIKDGTIPKNANPLLYRNLEQIQAEIKQNSSRPLINLQWLWNIWFKHSN